MVEILLMFLGAIAVAALLFRWNAVADRVIPSPGFRGQRRRRKNR